MQIFLWPENYSILLLHVSLRLGGITTSFLSFADNMKYMLDYEKSCGDQAMTTFTYESNTFTGELATNNIWLGSNENERITFARLHNIHKSLYGT